MAIQSLKDLYFDELGDLCDAEEQVERALARMAETARTPELRAALMRLVRESRFHLQRLELIFTHWGEARRPHQCEGMAAIVHENDHRLDELMADAARDAAIVGAAHRIAHYEIAAYAAARMYALRLNREDEARLLQETLDEEGRGDRAITAIAEAHVTEDDREFLGSSAELRASSI